MFFIKLASGSFIDLEQVQQVYVNPSRTEITAYFKDGSKAAFDDNDFPKNLSDGLSLLDWLDKVQMHVQQGPQNPTEIKTFN